MHTIDDGGRGSYFALAPKVNTQFFSLVNIELEEVVSTPCGEPLYRAFIVLDGC